MVSRAVLVAVLVAATGRAARADEVDRPTASYFFDRDATAFFWAPLATTIVIDTWVDPRERPLLFDTDEGGKESRKGGELPGYALTIGGGLVVGAIALGDDPARYHHAKGLAQSLATSGLVAVAGKRLFGRHRPDYGSGSLEDGRRSFPSGHSTRALATITYSALYLRKHGFDQWREPGTLPWWEVASYAGLGVLAVGLTGERVLHHRHHLSDVIVGGLIGVASSTLFFMYNESRYEKASTTVTRQLPAAGPMLSFGGSF